MKRILSVLLCSFSIGSTGEVYFWPIMDPENGQGQISMTADVELAGFQMNEKPTSVKTCPKHEMNLLLSETTTFFVSHNACVNIPQVQNYSFDGIPEMIVFKSMHFLKVIQKRWKPMYIYVSETMGIQVPY